MRIILTGATGFVGQNLLKHFSQAGWQIENISRQDTQVSIDQKMSDFKPDIVVHLATLFIAEHKPENISDLIQSNITFGTQIVDSMARHGIKNFINTGTLWQYYQGQVDIPSCLYAATKTAFESILKFYVSSAQLKVITLMLSDTYGPQDPRAKLLPKLLKMAGGQEKLQLSKGEQKIEWTYIDDIVKAYEIAALRLRQGQEPQMYVKYSVGSGEVMSLQQSVALCEKVIGKKIPVEFGTKPYRQREVMAPEKLDPQLPGWSANVSFVKGIEACCHG